MIELHLKPKESGQSLVENPTPLASEYATRYVESMGASPTPQNLEYIQKNLSVDKALLIPMPTRNTLVMFPGKGDKKVDIKDIFGIRQDDIDETLSTKNGEDNKKDNKKESNKDDGLNKSNYTNKSKNVSIKQLHGKSGGSKEEEEHEKATKGRCVSWCTVYTLDFLHPMVDSLGIEEIKSKKFKSMLRPLSVGPQQVKIPVETFIVALVDYVPSILEDTSGRLYTKLSYFLKSDSCVRLYGLLSHFIYWNIIHPCVRRACLQGQIVDPSDLPMRPTLQRHNSSLYELNESGATSGTSMILEDNNSITGGSIGTLDSATSLDHDEKEILFLQLQECYIDLQKVTRISKHALSTAHQGLICCCHYTVDHMLCDAYPWFYAKTNLEIDDDPDIVQTSNKLRLQMRRLMQQAISDLVDPSRLYTDAYLNLSNVDESDKIPVRNRNSADISKQYVTSVALRALLQTEARDPATRIILGYGNKKAYANAPGLKRHGKKELPGLFESKSYGSNKHDHGFSRYAAGTPHPLFGGATNSPEKGTAYVRPNFIHRKTAGSGKAARGPFGRSDGITCWRDEDGHVGEMLRLATIPAKKISYKEHIRKSHAGMTRRSYEKASKARVISLPNGQIKLKRSDSGKINTGYYDKTKEQINDEIPIDEIDRYDLFGSYEKLRKKREQKRQQLEEERAAKMSALHRSNTMATSTSSMNGDAMNMSMMSVDAEDSEFLDEDFDEEVARRGTMRALQTALNESDSRKFNGNIEPISWHAKRDLMNLVVGKTKAPYENTLFSSRAEILAGHDGGSNGH